MTGINAGIATVLLAGGKASRLGGGDKGRTEIGGASVLARVIDRMRPQTTRIVLNANGPAERFVDLRLDVIGDAVPGQLGPLAGTLTGLRWAKAQAIGLTHIITVPTDCPFLPFDLVARLASAREAASAEIAVASSLGRPHPVVALWPLSLADALESALVGEKLQKVQRFQERYRTIAVDFPALPIDPFFNVNTVEELQEARRLATFERP